MPAAARRSKPAPALATLAALGTVGAVWTRTFATWFTHDITNDRNDIFHCFVQRAAAGQSPWRSITSIISVANAASVVVVDFGANWADFFTVLQISAAALSHRQTPRRRFAPHGRNGIQGFLEVESLV